MTSARYPSLYQINTRVWLTQLARNLQRPATLDDIPDDALDQWRALGFDWIWLLSVWQTGLAGQQISRGRAEWRKEFQDTLPDLCDADIPGSGFAIADYRVHEALGGASALARLRERLRQRGLRLMLDFVPNHTALDHPWVADHPEYYVAGTESDMARAPYNYTRMQRAAGDLIMAHGRDPFFSGWPDTLQLNYGNAATQEALIGELRKIAGQCDGVRCDMAMLMLPDVFLRTWGIESQPFWPRATRCVRDVAPDFCFMAEVYWDLEWTLQQQGFDYTYDKRLYDRLRDSAARPVRDHLSAGLDYQDRMARFLENHDEPRAAAVFVPAAHRAAAMITYLAPGLRFFHQGQLEGHTKRISPHLCRGPHEPTDAAIEQFYQRLLRLLHAPALRDGHWQLLHCAPAWESNWTWDCFVSYAWTGADDTRLLVAVNYAPNQCQCYVQLPYDDLVGSQWQLTDQMSCETYEREGDELHARGLFLDMTPWQGAVYAMTRKR
jgi:glycosidase